MAELESAGPRVDPRVALAVPRAHAVDAPTRPGPPLILLRFGLLPARCASSDCPPCEEARLSSREELATTLEALRARLVRELERGAGSEADCTARVGGITRTSAALDRVWLSLWTYACGVTEREGAWVTHRSAAIPASQATAGQLARRLAQRVDAHESAQREPLRTALQQAREDSATMRFIALRNDVVHGRTLVDEPALRACYEELLAVVRRLLASLGD